MSFSQGKSSISFQFEHFRRIFLFEKISFSSSNDSSLSFSLRMPWQNYNFFLGVILLFLEKKKDKLNIAFVIFGARKLARNSYINFFYHETEKNLYIPWLHFLSLVLAHYTVQFHFFFETIQRPRIQKAITPTLRQDRPWKPKAAKR